MRLSLNEYKLPIGVTTVGLLIATGLAVAPVLMADSATDKLSANNAKNIESITVAMQEQSGNLDQRLNSQSSEISGQLKNLDAQVIVLNKAVKNISRKSRDHVSSTNTALNELTGGPRLVNLEKAVSNLHRKLSKASNYVQPNQDRIAEDNGVSDIRLENLEKAVKRLHLRQQKFKSQPIAADGPATPNANIEIELRLASMEREFRDVFGRVAAMETTVQQLSTTGNKEESRDSSSIVDSNPIKNESNFNTTLVSNGYDNQISELELLVEQLLRRQQKGSTINSMALSSNRTETDNRVKRLERVIARMDRRLNTIENTSTGQDDMIDQLYEIQDYIDQVLDQLNR